MSRSEINALPISGDAFRFLEIICRRMRHAQKGATVWKWQSFFGHLYGDEGWSQLIAQELKDAGLISQTGAAHKTDCISLTNKGVSYARACAC